MLEIKADRAGKSRKKAGCKVEEIMKDQAGTH